MNKTMAKNSMSIILVIASIFMMLFCPIKQLFANEEPTYSAPDYFTQTSAIESDVKIANIIEDNTFLCATSDIGGSVVQHNYLTLNIDDIVLVLDDTIVENSINLSLVLFINNNKNMFGYIPNQSYSLVNKNLVDNSLQTYFNNVKVYKYPSINSGIVKTLSAETCVEILNDVADYKDKDNNLFYAIKINDNNVGYILRDNLIKSGNFEPEPLTDYLIYEDNTKQMYAYAILVLALLILVVFVIIKILKQKKAD